MPILRIEVDLEVPDEHFPSDRQQEAFARETHNFVHNIAVDGYPIPEESIESNRNPNFTAHIHSSINNYCDGCLERAQDGRH